MYMYIIVNFIISHLGFMVGCGDSDGDGDGDSGVVCVPIYTKVLEVRTLNVVIVFMHTCSDVCIHIH